MKHKKLLPFHRLLLGAVFLALAASCQTQGSKAHDHWTEDSVGSSMARAFLTYDSETDGPYREFQWRKKQSINLTVRRHLFNHNPDNPFQAEDPTYYDGRPTHSLLPRFWDYIHVEGVALGAIAFGAGGVFVPIPVDSIMGTFDKGGDQEFMEGIGQTFRPLGVVTASFLHDALGFPETKGSGWRE